MKFALAKKVNMTQFFREDGAVSAVTVLSMLPMVVTQVKTKEKDGYTALQVGGGKRKEKNISKPVRGHTKELGSFVVLKEFKTGAEEGGSSKGGPSSSWKRGDKDLETFVVGDNVQVSSISKAKGFQGVVKRHGFHGGPRSHGQKHSEREAGSIGGGGRDGGRVAKGKRMAGRMGGVRVTIKNLNVLALEDSTMLVSGAIPGRRGTLIEIRSTKS